MRRNSTVMKSTMRLSVLVMLVSQLACGAKVSDVLTKYRGDFQKKRDQFQAIARALPPKAADKPCAGLNPPIDFNDNTKQYNTEVVMFEQLLDPDVSPKFDLHLNRDLFLAILWTGPKNPLSPSVLNKSGSNTEKTLQAALKYRYVVVNRVLDLQKPTAVSEKTYTPGLVAIDVFVVDLANNQPACSFSLQAQSAAETSYTYKKGESKQEKLEDFAHSSMWEDARQKLIAGLKKVAGGDIQIK